MSYKIYSADVERTYGKISGQGYQRERIYDLVESCKLRNIDSVFESILPNGKILEAGCGEGGWVIHLRRKGYEVIGVDISSEDLRNARRYDTTIPLLTSDIAKLPFMDRSFEAVICLGVVEHYEDGPLDLLKEMYRVLEPKGLLLLTVPYENLLRKIVHHPMACVYFSIERFLLRRKLVFGEYRYSRREITNLLEETGFKVVQVCVDEYVSADRCLALWVDWLFVFRSRDKTKYAGLNWLGKRVKALLSLFTLWIYSGGILICCEKPPDCVKVQ
ncbi:Ubiquinone biosynthesis O-methyltransferase [subsurface metagenome]